jgi:hypothetical protein
MPDPAWADYLEAVGAHLHQARRAVEEGRTSPDPPPRPTGTPPDALQPRARRLALAYDQLALEVATRLAGLEVRVTPRRPESPAPAYYVDRKA